MKILWNEKRYFLWCICKFLTIMIYGEELVYTSDELFNFAEGLYLRGMYDLARQEYMMYLERFLESSQNDLVFFRLGECCVKTGKRGEAIKFFERVFKEFPQSKYRFKAGFRLAEIFMNDSGSIEKGIEVFKSIIESSPPDDISAVAYFYMARGFATLKKNEEAIQALTVFREKYHNTEIYPYAILEMANLYSKEDLEHKKQAMALYEELINRNVEEEIKITAYTGYILMAYKLKEYSLVWKYFLRFRKDFPNSTKLKELHLFATWSAYNTGLYQEALQEANYFIGSGKDASCQDKRDEWLYLKANCMRQLGKYAEAATVYQELINIKSSLIESAQFERLICLYKLGLYDKYLEEVKEININDNNRRQIYWMTAESFAAVGKTENAIQYYSMILKEFKNSDIADISCYKAACYLYKEKKYNEAIGMYDELIKNYPASAFVKHAIYTLAMCYTLISDYSSALSVWDSFIKRYNKDPLVEDALYQKGLCQIRLEEPNGALSTFKMLVKNYPNSRYIKEAYLWMGIALLENRKFQDAIEMFEEVLKKADSEDIKNEARFYIGVAFQNLGRMDESTTIFKELLKTDLRYRFKIEQLIWLAEYCLMAKFYNDVVIISDLIFEKAASEEEKVKAFYYKGRCLAELNKNKEAIEYLEKVVNSNLRTYGSHSAVIIGNVLLSSFPEKAEKYFLKAIDMAPENNHTLRAMAYLGIGKCAFEKKEWEKAGRFFLTVAVLYDDKVFVPESLYYAYKSFLLAGRKEEALKARNEILDRFAESEWAIRVKEEKNSTL